MLTGPLHAYDTYAFRGVILTMDHIVSSQLAPSTARSAARGARLYRSAFGRAVEIVDIIGIILIAALVLKVLTMDRLLAASLAATLPVSFGALALWWTLRENDLYNFPARPNLLKRAWRTFGAIILAFPLGTLAGGMVAYSAGRPLSEGFFEAAIVVSVAGLGVFVSHFIATVLVGALSDAGLFSLNIVIVGATKAAEKIVSDAAVSGDLNILGIFDDRLARAPKQIGGVDVIGDLTALMSWEHLPTVDRVIVTVSSAAQSRVKHLVEKLRAMPNKLVLAIDMQGFDADGTTIGRIGNQPVAYVSGAPEDARRAFWKRLQDVCIGTLALILLSPIMILVAIAIKLDSRGPVFFRQTRHGFNNQPFQCWKFRSMRTDMTDHKSAQQVQKDDPRVTGVGRFIRKTSLDELPQLFNVLIGNMSLVGPRPHAIGMKTGNVESEKLVADYAHRHRIKPGMTGWAAINGSRGPVDTSSDVEERVGYDVAYIKGASFWFDIYIMAMTIPSLLGDKEAIR
jgi:polysaccharide biosynthesis protein PslA